GAASGIGLALIEELLAYGAEKVVLADFNAVNLKKHTDRLSAEYPGRVKGILCDVTKENEVVDMIAEAAEFFGGRIDLLINNAGAGVMGMFTESYPPIPEKDRHGMIVQTNKDWEKAFALNFYGALYGCREVIPIMQKNGGGQVINVISGIAFYPMAYQSMYAATKAALNGLTLSLRYEYWDDNIKFNAATPGTTATAIWGDMAPPPTAQTPQQSARRILAQAAKNRRVIFGDDPDEAGAKNCFHPDHEDIPDTYLLEVARARRSGESTRV
ncbi:MAG: SDR family oxidoreductase, partial [Thermovirga sp.]|nr:SDR family oxidoreductase [Thermovirga sp.]